MQRPPVGSTLRRERLSKMFTGSDLCGDIKPTACVTLQLGLAAELAARVRRSPKNIRVAEKVTQQAISRRRFD